MKVTFWGTRGSIPTPGHGTTTYGGNTSCVEVRCGETILVLDAGTGIRELGRSLLREAAGRPLTVHLLLSHTHWDHIQGFPFFEPAYEPSTTLHVYGAGGPARPLAHVLRGQMEEDYFPVALNDLECRLLVHEFDGQELRLGDVTVAALPLNHTSRCLAFRVRQGAKTLVYATDHEPEALRHGKPSAATVTPEDGTADAEFVRFAAGADLYIGEAQYTDEEYAAHVGWGHSALSATVGVALAAGVRSLALYHHDPDHADRAIGAMVERARQLVAARGARLECLAAAEGLVLQL